LSEIKSTGVLPSEVCDNFILWQCLLDVIVKRHLSVSTRSETSIHRKPRILSIVEQNAIRYTAGAVIRKLFEKSVSEQQISCLHGFLKRKDESNVSDDDTSETWIKFIDRGGLYSVTDVAFDLFIEIEDFTYHHLQLKEPVKNLSQLATQNAQIMAALRPCVIDSDIGNVELLDLLYKITMEWTKTRGNAMVSIEIEKYKKKKSATTNKRKSLRKDLQQQKQN
jgi:hypothetical protein